jgi:hypothetical protein
LVGRCNTRLLLAESQLPLSPRYLACVIRFEDFRPEHAPPRSNPYSILRLTYPLATTTTMAQAASTTPAPSRPRPHPPSSAASSTWSNLDQDDDRVAGGGNQGLWSLLTAASKYEEFEEIDDDDSVDSVRRGFVRSTLKAADLT